MSKQKRKLKKNQVAIDGKLYDVTHPMYAQLYEDKIAPGEIVWDEDNQEWITTAKTAYSTAPKWNPKLSKAKNDEIYEKWQKKQDPNYVANQVRKGTGNFATGVAQGAGAFGLGIGEIMNTPLAAIGEVVSGRGDFNSVLPNMERALSNVGVGEYTGNQQMTPGNALFPNNPLAATILDIPADILLTRGANTLFKQGSKQVPKLLSRVPKLGKVSKPDLSAGIKLDDEIINKVKSLKNKPVTQAEIQAYYRPFLKDDFDTDLLVSKIYEYQKKNPNVSEKEIQYLVLRDPDILKMSNKSTNTSLDSKYIDVVDDFRLKRGLYYPGSEGMIRGMGKAYKGVEPEFEDINQLTLKDLFNFTGKVPEQQLSTQFTPQQLLSIDRYSKGFDATMNSQLRNPVKKQGLLSKLLKKGDGQENFQQAIKEDSDALLGAIKQNKFDESTELYRGMAPFKAKIKQADGTVVEKLYPTELIEGDEFLEKGFMSTATHPSIGASDIIINAPGNNKQSFLYLNSVPESSHFINESEALLPPGLNLKHSGKTKQVGNKTLPIFDITNPYMQAGIIGTAGASMLPSQEESALEQKAYGGKINNMKKNKLPKMNWGGKLAPQLFDLAANALVNSTTYAVTDMIKAIREPEQEMRPTKMNTGFTMATGGIVNDPPIAKGASKGISKEMINKLKSKTKSISKGLDSKQNSLSFSPTDMIAVQEYFNEQEKLNDPYSPEYFEKASKVKPPARTKTPDSTLENIVEFAPLLGQIASMDDAYEALQDMYNGQNQQGTFNNVIDMLGVLPFGKAGNLFKIPKYVEKTGDALSNYGLMKDVLQDNVVNKANGGMIKRADGSYSKRGLWDNIRANKGSGKKPTKKMLEQERKIRAQMDNGGTVYPYQERLNQSLRQPGFNPNIMGMSTGRNNVGLGLRGGPFRQMTSLTNDRKLNPADNFTFNTDNSNPKFNLNTRLGYQDRFGFKGGVDYTSAIGENNPDTKFNVGFDKYGITGDYNYNLNKENPNFNYGVGYSGQGFDTNFRASKEKDELYNFDAKLGYDRGNTSGNFEFTGNRDDYNLGADFKINGIGTNFKYANKKNDFKSNAPGFKNFKADVPDNNSNFNLGLLNYDRNGLSANYAISRDNQNPLIHDAKVGYSKNGLDANLSFMGNKLDPKYNFNLNFVPEKAGPTTNANIDFKNNNLSIGTGLGYKSKKFNAGVNYKGSMDVEEETGKQSVSAGAAYKGKNFNAGIDYDRQFATEENPAVNKAGLNLGYNKNGFAVNTGVKYKTLSEADKKKDKASPFEVKAGVTYNPNYKQPKQKTTPWKLPKELMKKNEVINLIDENSPTPQEIMFNALKKQLAPINLGKRAFGGMITPDMYMQQLMYGSYANGGEVPQNIPVEVEGGEAYELPNGEMGEFEGPSHDNGGIPVALPEQTKVYSKQLKVNGKTMADRKTKREANVAKLEKILSKNPSDKFIKEALKRQQETAALEEQQDMAMQEQANQQQQMQQQAQQGMMQEQAMAGLMQDPAMMQQMGMMMYGGKLNKLQYGGEPIKPLPMKQIYDLRYPNKTIDVPYNERYIGTYSDVPLTEEMFPLQNNIVIPTFYDNNQIKTIPEQDPSPADLLKQKLNSLKLNAFISEPEGPQFTGSYVDKPKPPKSEATKKLERFAEFSPDYKMEDVYEKNVSGMPSDFKLKGTTIEEDEDLTNLDLTNLPPYFNTKKGVIMNPLYDESTAITEEPKSKKPNKFMNWLNKAADETGDFFSGLFDKNGKPKKEKGTKKDEKGLPLTAGDRMGMAGTLFGGLAPMTTTMLNRMMTPKNQNFFREYGAEGLRAMQEAQALSGINRDKQLADIKMGEEASRQRGRNSARGVNTLRAMDVAADITANQSQNQAYNMYAQQMMQLLGQKAQMENQQDQAVMQGEYTRDLADRQDVDQFYTNLAENFASQSELMQKQGRDMNQSQYNKMIMEMSPLFSKYGIGVEMRNGKVVMVKDGKTMDETTAQLTAEKIAEEEKKKAAGTTTGTVTPNTTITPNAPVAPVNPIAPTIDSPLTKIYKKQFKRG
jgi:hypothetical protein